MLYLIGFYSFMNLRKYNLETFGVTFFNRKELLWLGFEPMTLKSETQPLTHQVSNTPQKVEVVLPI